MSYLDFEVEIGAVGDGEAAERLHAASLTHAPDPFR